MKNSFKDLYVFTDDYDYFFFKTKDGISSKYKKQQLAENFSNLSENEKNDSLKELTYCGKVKFSKYAIKFDFSCKADKVNQPKICIIGYFYLENEETNENQYLICNYFTKSSFLNLPVIISNGTLYYAIELNSYYGGTKNKFSSKKYYSYLGENSIEPKVHFACDADIVMFISNRCLKKQLEKELFNWISKYKNISIDLKMLDIHKKIYNEYYIPAFEMFRNSVNDFMNAFNIAKAETFGALCTLPKEYPTINYGSY